MVAEPGRAAPPAAPSRTGTRRHSRRRAESVLTWLDSAAWNEAAYFALPETNHLVELSGGKLIVHDMPSLAHQRASRQCFLALHTWNQQAAAGEVLYAPYPVRLWEGEVREPDVLFYLNEHRDRMDDQRGGPPDVAIEVLTPSTRSVDLREKLALYARARICEYWTVEPIARWIEVHLLEGERYRRVGRYTAGQTATSPTFPGFSVAVDDVAGATTA